MFFVFTIVVWDVTPCTVIEIYRHFRRMSCLFSNRVYLKIEAACPSKAVVYARMQYVIFRREYSLVAVVRYTRQNGRTGGTCVQSGTPDCFSHEPVWWAGIFSKWKWTSFQVRAAWSSDPSAVQCRLNWLRFILSYLSVLFSESGDNWATIASVVDWRTWM